MRLIEKKLTLASTTHTSNTKKCYFCDKKKLVPKIICLYRIALDINVLREDTTSYMIDTNLLIYAHCFNM